MESAPRRLDSAIRRLSDARAAGELPRAVDALGAHRGEEGIALGEALGELEAAYAAVVGEAPPPALLRRLAVAWAEAALGPLVARGALDPRTGLATVDYLVTRLRDIARTGESAGRRLVIASGPAPTASRFAAMLRAARIGADLAASFPLGETPAGLPDGRIAMITPADEGLDAHLARARIVLRAIGEEDADVEAVALPTAAEAVPAFIAGL